PRDPQSLASAEGRESAMSQNAPNIGIENKAPSTPPPSASRPISPAGETVSYDPATLEEVGRVPNTDLSRMPEIFARARAAQSEWAKKPFSVRKRHILKMRDYVVAHAEELAEIVSR